MAKTSKSAKKESTATIGYEAKLIKGEAGYAGSLPEDADESKTGNTLVVPDTTKNVQNAWHAL